MFVFIIELRSYEIDSIILCFYFTLSFIESLRNGDKRIIKQSKIAAITCLTLALLLPIAYNLIFG